MLNFKELRKKKNYTQIEFSELIGVSARALSNYENGNTDITLKKLQEIADILKVSFYDLFIKEELDSKNLLEEPREIYNKNINTINENYTLLHQNNSIKDELIDMLKEKVSILENKLQKCIKEKNKLQEH